MILYISYSSSWNILIHFEDMHRSPHPTIVFCVILRKVQLGRGCLRSTRMRLSMRNASAAVQEFWSSAPKPWVQWTGKMLEGQLWCNLLPSKLHHFGPKCHDHCQAASMRAGCSVALATRPRTTSTSCSSQRWPGEVSTNWILIKHGKHGKSPLLNIVDRILSSING